MKLRHLLPALLCVTLSISAKAQGEQPFTNGQAARKPLWIPMLDDTTANFFYVEKAFALYFSRHELPEEEHDVIGEHAEREKHLSKRALRRRAAEDAMRMDVKRYHFWHEQTLPYVQPDGRILTPAERLQIWRNQQQQR